MTASVFTDPIRGAAILVSDEPLFALGPILVADEVEEAMEGMAAFVAALGEDPSDIPTIRLMIEWQGFLAAITPGPFVGDQSAQEPPDGQATGEPGESSPESLSGPTRPGDGSQDAAESSPADSPEPEQTAEPPAPADDAGATPHEPEDEEEDEEEELDLSDRLKQIPGGTPRQRGKIECFACGGTGTAIGTEGVTCNLCGGTGKIDEPEPQATTTTTEEQA